MAATDDAQEAILNRIMELAPKAPTATALREMAEAVAWIIYPGQPHGGATNVTVSK